MQRLKEIPSQNKIKMNHTARNFFFPFCSLLSFFWQCFALQAVKAGGVSAAALFVWAGKLFGEGELSCLPRRRRLDSNRELRSKCVYLFL